MKIPVTSVRQLLSQGRVFAGRGTRNINNTGLGFPDGAVTSVQTNITLEPYSTYWGQTALSLVSMGSFSYTHSRLPHEVQVGRYTSIAKGMSIMGDSHPLAWASTSPVFYNHKALMRTYMEDQGTDVPAQRFSTSRGEISIGNDVWIGENVTLGHGITIGDGAVIASNAVVTKDVRSYTVVGGLPAKKIKDRFAPDTIELLLESEWWRYAPDQLAPYDVTEPEQFARSVIERRSSGAIEPFNPQSLTYQDFEAINV